MGPKVQKPRKTAKTHRIGTNQMSLIDMANVIPEFPVVVLRVAVCGCKWLCVAATGCVWLCVLYYL